MGKPHKDLPGGSQAWAAEVDALMGQVAALTEVVKRLSANAGIDFSNPKRGINTGDTPSVQNPVGQKLSSLADVSFYNVADGQVPTWSQKNQKWLPVTLPTPTAGGTIDISEVSYSSLAAGYGEIANAGKYSYTGAGMVGDEPFRNAYTESWTTGSAYIGAGDWNNGTGYALIELAGDGFSRPYVQLNAYDYADGTGASFVVASYQIRVVDATFEIMAVPTSNRPSIITGTREGASVYDTDLGIPIWWNGTTWTNALGTAV